VKQIMTDTPKRILVTGSRHWPNTPGGWEAVIGTIAQHLPPNTMTSPPPGHGTFEYHAVIIVYGDCNTGVDSIIHGWERHLRGRPHRIGGERYRANWHTEGPSAGPNRNQRMTDSGAHVCLGFPYGSRSRGTLDCMNRAMAARIPTFVTELHSDQWRTRPVGPGLLADLWKRYR
jgi:hypothetical protein